VQTSKVILYADDDQDDKLWVSEAWRALNYNASLQFVENGRQALDYLTTSLYSLPSLIVLDLNMPELDGKQTLQKIKSNPEYDSIPVVIVTTSASKMDRDICSRLGASLFLTKPDTLTEWKNIVRQIEPLIA